MHEVKVLEVGMMYKSHASRAIQKCLHMIRNKEEISFYFLLGYHDCLDDFQLTNGTVMDFESPNEVFVLDKDLMIRNITKCLHKIRRQEADVDGYVRCLIDLGLLEESEEH